MIIRAQHAGALGCEDLAKTGINGKHPNTIPRDMMRILLRKADFPMPYLAKIPLNSLVQGEQKILVDYPFLLPHEVIRWGLTNRRLNMKDLVDVANRIDQELPIIKEKFCNWFALDPDCTFLLGFHGDGVAHHRGLKQASTEVYSWNFHS